MSDIKFYGKTQITQHVAKIIHVINLNVNLNQLNSYLNVYMYILQLSVKSKKLNCKNVVNLQHMVQENKVHEYMQKQIL